MWQYNPLNTTEEIFVFVICVPHKWNIIYKVRIDLSWNMLNLGKPQNSGNTEKAAILKKSIYKLYM